MTLLDIPEVAPTITIAETTVEDECHDDGFLAPAMTPLAEPTPMPPEVHEGVSEEQVQVTRRGRSIRPPVQFQDYIMNEALQHIDQEEDLGGYRTCSA
jgi:hypothetical protein